jgi:hypothetical protein
MQKQYIQPEHQILMTLIRKLDDQSAHIGMLESLLRNVYPSLDAQSAQYVDQTLRNSKVRTAPST